MESVLQYVPYAIGGIVGIYLLKEGLHTIRPTHLGAVETFGKYTGFRKAGLTFVIPFVQKLRTVNTTERLVDVEKQDVITKENLNCKIDAQVYYKIKREETEMKNALYQVNDVNFQIVELAQSTLRAVIGQKMFKDVNANRTELNKSIFTELTEQTKNWGVQIVRVELKEIFPPQDVQQTMNEIIKAENEKDKQADLAKAKIIATEGNAKAMVIDADGRKKKQIIDSEAVKEMKRIEAEGEKQKIELNAEAEKNKQILEAQGEANAIQAVATAEAQAIKEVETSKRENFVDTAIVYKSLETEQKKFENNSKIITDGKTALTLIENETKEKIIPVEVKVKTKKGDNKIQK